MELEELSTKINNLLTKLAPLLNEAMPEENANISNHLKTIDAYAFTVGYYRALLQEHLTIMEHELMPQKSEGTGAERILTMKARTASVRSIVDILDSAHDAIKRRISLGQTLLKANKDA